MTTRSYAHIGCATVLLGGAGLLFTAGGLEALQQGTPLGWLAIAGGQATWAALGFLYWINARAYRRQEEAKRQPYAPSLPKRGGFWKGFFVTWSIVVAAHVAAFLGMGFADLLPHPEQARAIFSLLVLALVPAHVVVPVLGGTVYGLVRSTALRQTLVNLRQPFPGPFGFVVGPLMARRASRKAAPRHPPEARMAQARDKGFAWQQWWAMTVLSLMGALGAFAMLSGLPMLLLVRHQNR